MCSIEVEAKKISQFIILRVKVERVYTKGGVSVTGGWRGDGGKFYSESDAAWKPREGSIVLVLIKPASNPAHDSRQTCGNTHRHRHRHSHISYAHAGDNRISPTESKLLRYLEPLLLFVTDYQSPISNTNPPSIYLLILGCIVTQSLYLPI